MQNVMAELHIRWVPYFLIFGTSVGEISYKHIHIGTHLCSSSRDMSRKKASVTKVK